MSQWCCKLTVHWYVSSLFTQLFTQPHNVITQNTLIFEYELHMEGPARTICASSTTETGGPYQQRRFYLTRLLLHSMFQTPDGMEFPIINIRTIALTSMLTRVSEESVPLRINKMRMILLILSQKYRVIKMVVGVSTTFHKQ